MCPQMTHPHMNVDALQVPSALHILAGTIGSLWACVDGLEQELGLRRREFRSVRAEVEGIRQSQEEWECLDVGGTCFHAARGVLGGNHDQFFSVLLSEEFASERGSDGTIFIDRDPEHFPLILHYLREGEVHMPVQGKGLLREARYYGLQELSATKCCLTILPCDGSAAHVYDGLGWQRLPSVAVPAATECVTCWGGRLTASVPRNYRHCVDVLDPMPLQWNRVSESPGHFIRSIAAVGSQLFARSSTSGHVAAYITNGQWEMLPRMSQDHRCGYAICAMGSGIAAVGGMCPSTAQFLRTVERFSVTEKQWEQLPEMGHARYCPGATMWQGKLVVVGGYRDGRFLNSAEAYDPDRGVWQAMPPLVHARYAPVVVVYGGRLIVSGGYTDCFYDDRVAEVEEYDVDAQLWKVIHCVEGGGLAAVVSLPRRLWKY